MTALDNADRKIRLMKRTIRAEGDARTMTPRMVQDVTTMTVDVLSDIVETLSEIRAALESIPATPQSA